MGATLRIQSHDGFYKFDGENWVGLWFKRSITGTHQANNAEERRKSNVNISGSIRSV